MPHDHAAEVLGDDLDKEVEDHRFYTPLARLATVSSRHPIITLEVDMDEDFARMERYSEPH